MLRRQLFWVFLIFVLSFFSFKSLLQPGYFSMHDDLLVGRLYQMDLCFKDHQVPCRWVPDMGFGYGYPLFNYYPPLPYYLGEVFHLLGVSYIDSIKSVFILGLLFSGLFAYLLGKELWGRYGGFVSAIFYVYAPYHALDIYVRGAMNEFWGLVFFPAVFWAVYKLVKEERRSFVLVLAISYALLLLSHNLMAFFISPALAAFAVFLIWYLKKPKKLIFKLVAGFLWGMGLAAFFTLPMIFEQKLVHIDTMFIGYFNYLAHFATLSQLFFSRFWGYGPSTWGPEDGMTFPVGQLHWFLALISLLIFGYFWLKGRRKEFYLIILIFFFFVGFAFLAHQRSSFIWEKLSILATTQFPWRFVGLASFFATVLVGSIFVLVEKEKVALILAFVLSLSAIFYNFSFFRPEKILNISDQEKLFSAKGWNKLQTDAIFDYLPLSAKAPPDKKAPEEPELISGKAEILEFKRGTNWQKGAVEAEGIVQVRLPLYYFPGFKVWVDHQEVAISDNNDLGLITFEVPSGKHTFEARLTDTLVRRSGNLLTLFSFLLLVGWLSHEKIFAKK